jgi:hypothetical protein
VRAKGRSFTKYERSVRQHLRTGGIATLRPVKGLWEGVGRGAVWGLAGQLAEPSAEGQKSAVVSTCMLEDRSPL